MYIYSRLNVEWWPDDRCAGLMATMPKRMFKITYSLSYASHETATSQIVQYWNRITCSSIWKHNVYIRISLQLMERLGTFARITFLLIKTVQRHHGGNLVLVPFLLTINYMHTNSDYNDITYTILFTMSMTSCWFHWHYQTYM